MLTSLLNLVDNGAPQAKPVVPCPTPMWGDIPATRWRIPPRPKAVVSRCRDNQELFMPIEKLRMVVLASLMAALTAVGAYIHVPIGPVPIVLSTLFALLSRPPAGKSLGTGQHGPLPSGGSHRHACFCRR